MDSFVHLSVFHYSECGQPGRLRPRILEGHKTSIEEMPWMVAVLLIRNETYSLRCTGFIVSELHVITAAHCLIKKEALPNIEIISDFFIGFGSNQWLTSRVSDVDEVWM